MKIIRNAIRCKKCGEVIESKSVHDFKFCSCGACAVDGGHEYLRRCGELEDWEELAETEETDDDWFRLTKYSLCCTCKFVLKVNWQPWGLIASGLLLFVLYLSAPLAIKSKKCCVNATFLLSFTYIFGKLAGFYLTAKGYGVTMKKAGVCGHFGFGRSLFNGQTVKTKMWPTSSKNILAMLRWLLLTAAAG